MIQLLVSAGSPVDTINIEGQKASSYGPTAQTREAIQQGLGEFRVAQSRISEIQQRVVALLISHGIVESTAQVIASYWDTFWHYFMGIR